jgi:hypothetical protein
MKIRIEASRQLGLNVLMMLVLVSVAGAVPAQVVEIAVGKGPQQLSFSGEVADDSSQGPEALVPVDEGFAVMDSKNRKIVQIDGKGTFVKSFPLPAGVFDDLAIDNRGHFITIDGSSRKVLDVQETVRELFVVPSGKGFPDQIDGYQMVGDALVMFDFGTEKFYVFSLDGKLRNSFSFPTILSFVASSENLIAFLSCNAQNPEEVSLLYYDLEGNQKRNIRIIGKEILQLQQSARLLGFAKSGQAIAFGWDESGNGILFSIDEKGAITRLAVVAKPISAHRYGAVGQNHVWLNASSEKTGKFLFHRFDLP